MSQLPRHGAVGSWEDSSKCSAPGVVSAQSVLSIGVQFLFVLLRSRGVLCQNERAGIFKFKSLKEKTSTRALRGALSLHWFVSFFRVTSLQDFMYIRQVPLPVSCAYFFVKCERSHPEGSARIRERGLGRRKRAGENIMESESFRGKSAGGFILSPLNYGFKQFPREGEIRSSMGNNFIYPGRGREPKFNRSHIFFINYFRGFYTKKNGKRKGGKPGGGSFF